MSWTLTPSLLKNYISDVFLETGTFQGEGIQLAIDLGFKEIHSLEIKDSYYQNALNKFKDNKNVFLHKGDSSLDLLKICKQISEDKKITFWLDGHDGVQGSSGTDSENPLLKELCQIKQLEVKTHNILIDDVRCFGNLLKHTKEEIEGFIKDININYNIKYCDSKVADNDILAATVLPS